MRVLQLIDSLDPGGAERVAVSYANALSKEIEASYLCTTRKEGALKQQLNGQLGYLFLKKRSTFDLLAILRLVRFCKSHKIQVIHAHTSSYFTATLASVLLKNCKLIWHDHYGNSELLDQRPKRVLNWCSKYFSAVLAVNEALANWAKINLKCAAVHYFKNAVPVLNPAVIEAAIIKGHPGQRILLMANFREQKDHRTALRAFQIVHKQLPESSLHLLGMHWNNSYYEEIIGLINQLDIKQAVHLHGSRQNVNGFIKACDLGMLSSISEGLPMSLLEYAALQLPVVCTNVGQCAAVIQNDGLLVPPGQPELLAAALLKALKNKEQSLTRARALQERVKSDYSIQTIIPNLLQIYGTHC